jgi:hypothetical protein
VVRGRPWALGGGAAQCVGSATSSIVGDLRQLDCGMTVR